MTMYLPLLPDGTPPDGAVPDSPRYERLTKYEVPEHLRLPLGATGGAAIVLGAVMMYFGDPWGILSCVAGSAPLVAAFTGGGSSAEYRESQSGAFVEATTEHEEQATYASGLKAGTLPVWYRVVAGLGGLPMAILAVLALFESPFGADDLRMVLIVGALAAALLYVAITGRSLWRTHEPPLPPRFRELADPALPLPAELFARDALPATRLTAEADVPPRLPADTMDR